MPPFYNQTRSEYSTMTLPAALHYTSEHLWVQESDDGTWLAGITDYAQNLLGDVVFLDLPKVGDSLTAGESCGLVESVKTGSDLHAPVDGVVTEVNVELPDMPENINDHPYKSWMFKFKPNDANVTERLMNAEAYGQLID